MGSHPHHSPTEIHPAWPPIGVSRPSRLIANPPTTLQTRAAAATTTQWQPAQEPQPKGEETQRASRTCQERAPNLLVSSSRPGLEPHNGVESMRQREASKILDRGGGEREGRDRGSVHLRPDAYLCCHLPCRNHDQLRDGHATFPRRDLNLETAGLDHGDALNTLRVASSCGGAPDAASSFLGAALDEASYAEDDDGGRSVRRPG